MKFLHAAAYALVASQATVIAAPTAVADPIAENSLSLVEYRSANPEHMALATLEKRINCRNIRRTIRGIGTSKFIVIYITLANVLARSICAYANSSNCEDLAYLIQTGLNLIYIAAAHYAGAQPEILPGAKKRDDIHDSYVDWWVNSLAASSSDVNYESITTLPFNSTEETLTRRDGDPELVSRVYLAGVTAPHSPESKQDIIVNHFADGNTVLHLPFGPSETVLGKRVPAGSGFKISFTTRGKSLLTASHQRQMSASASASWATATNRYAMTDYIGFAETDHSANFYYRIIPETRAFGLNYESVDICGGMASFL